MNTIQLLDAVKASQGIASDYAAAARLGLTKAQVSRYRNGKDQMGDEVAARAAELAGLDPAVVVAQLHGAKARDDGSRALWQGIAQRLARAGVAGIVGVVGLAGAPDAGASLRPFADPGVTPDSLYIMSTHIGARIQGR